MVSTTSLGPVSSCRRYPVKSFQGIEVDELTVTPTGVTGDRTHAVIEQGTGRLLSAKRHSVLLTAWADDDTITLPDGRTLALDDPEASAAISAWIGVPVALTPASALDPSEQLSFEMTFDPPDDGAEYYEIPAPAGSFLDCAPLHVVTSATLEACRTARGDLDWDPRRFRPNLVLDVDGPAFVEDAWTGRRLRLGDDVVLEVQMPTVRCAMPLRAQPAGGSGPALQRQPAMFAAMNDLHAAHPNHLGFYATVVSPGRVRRGDAVVLLDD
ncbi:MAG: MOSC domain-containing protein [Microthrixaceae bacterium]